MPDASAPFPPLPRSLGRLAAFLVLVALAVLLPSESNTAPPNARRIGPAGAGAELYELSNGLRVVLLESHASPVIASTVLVRAGVRDEKPTTNGAAHLLEHLLFDGTPTRTQEQIAREVDLIGGYNNATTRDEYTLFQFLAHRDVLVRALDIQADMLLRSTIDEASFEKERKVALEELARDASSPGYGSAQFFRKTWFGADPRSMPALGTKDSLLAMKRENVIAFYRERYRPDQMLVFLAGDLETASALALVEKAFGASARAGAQPESASQVPPARREEAKPREPARTGLYKERIAGERGYLRIGLPAPGAGEEDAAAVRALANLLGGEPGSRLAQALASPANPLVVEASASYASGLGEGLFEITAILPPDSDGIAAIRAVRAQLANLAAAPVPANELRAVVSEQAANVVFLRDQIHYLGMQIAPDLILASRPAVDAETAALPSLTPGLVQAAAKRWLTKPPLVTLSSPAVPSGTDPATPAPLPEPDAASAAANTHESGSAAQGSTNPSGRTRHVRRVDLENGLALIVAENPDSEVFAAHILVRDRAAMEPPGKDGIADLLHRLLPYGSLLLDGEGITQKLKAIGARLKTVDDPDIPYDDQYNSARYSYIRFEAVRQSWREGMGLLYALVAHPRLAKRDVALAASEEIDLARRVQETPRTLAWRLYAKTLLEDGPLAHPITGTPTTITGIKQAEIAAFHKRYFSPDQLILTIVSDVPASEVVEVVRSTFGELPPGPGAPSLAPLKPGEVRKRASRTGSPPLTRAATKVEVASGKDQSQILVGGVFERRDIDFPPLIVATTLLSTALSQDLRETRGLGYSVGCTLEDFGGRSWFTAQIGTRPENVDEVERRIREAIGSFAHAQVVPAQIERAINAMRGQMAMRRLTRIGQAYALGFNEFLGREVGFDERLDAALAAVTPADVNRVAGRYLDPDRMVTAIAR